MPSANDENLEKLHQLKLEHGDLNEIIALLQEQTVVDQLQLRRLKKRKLLLKDIIIRLESKLIPDLDA
ncbi:MAG: DUF465 domain-containing protein [Sulfuriflexus sp.]|nr:DUF465 domain-containing protein [Sulfuriflexus sp.]